MSFFNSGDKMSFSPYWQYITVRNVINFSEINRMRVYCSSWGASVPRVRRRRVRAGCPGRAAASGSTGSRGASRRFLHNTSQAACPRYRGPGQTRYTVQRARPNQVHSTEGQPKPGTQYREIKPGTQHRGPGQSRYTVQRARPNQICSTEGQAKLGTQYRGPG